MTAARFSCRRISRAECRNGETPLGDIWRCRAASILGSPSGVVAGFCRFADLSNPHPNPSSTGRRAFFRTRFEFGTRQAAKILGSPSSVVTRFCRFADLSNPHPNPSPTGRRAFFVQDLSSARAKRRKCWARQAASILGRQLIRSRVCRGFPLATALGLPASRRGLAGGRRGSRPGNAGGRCRRSGGCLGSRWRQSGCGCAG